MKESFLAHLAEFKRRFLACLVFFMVAAGISWGLSPQLLHFLIMPLMASYGPTFQLVYLTLPEGFFLHLKLACWGGFIGTLPFLVYQLWAFLKPALKPTERPLVRGLLAFSPPLFLAGAALAYYIIMPAAWTFFLSFEYAPTAPVPQTLLPHAEAYVGLTLQILLAFGLSFQLPLLIILGGQLGLFTAAGLKSKRRYVIVLMFILGAILTPPDVISQIGLALPLIALFEVSVWIVGYRERL